MAFCLQLTLLFVFGAHFRLLEILFAQLFAVEIQFVIFEVPEYLFFSKVLQLQEVVL